MKYDIWYIFCYSKYEYKNALERLKLSIISIKCKRKINILSWHKNLEKDINNLIKTRKIKIYQTNKQKFSRSYLINLIPNLMLNSEKYFYLADTDLFFHPEYFEWLDFLGRKLNHYKNDLRIITSNFNIRPRKKLKFIPSKLFNLISTYLPKLYDWSLPMNFNQILNMELSKKGYAHGCGLIPIESLKKIGGYNEEIIGYGPEDDLFNQRLKFFARVYYHKGGIRSSTFHIYHSKLNHQNKKKNWHYWNKIIKDIDINSIHSDYIIR